MNGLMLVLIFGAVASTCLLYLRHVGRWVRLGGLGGQASCAVVAGQSRVS